MKKLNEKQVIFNKIINQLLQNKNEKNVKKLIDSYFPLGEKFERGRSDFRNIFEAVIFIYNDLKKNYQKVNQSNLKFLKIKTKRISKNELSFLEKREKKYKIIKFIQFEIEDKLKDYLDYFFVHGSYATQDFKKNWSDLDTMIILNENAFRDVKTLKYLQKLFLKLSQLVFFIDLFAHHKFFFITNEDLNYYPQTFLPVVVYQNAWDLLNKNGELNIYLREDKREKMMKIFNFLKHFKDRFVNNKTRRNIFFFKDDLSRLMLLPSLFLQYKNIYVCKKDSFDLVKKEFPELDFNVVETASLLRENWIQNNLLIYFSNLYKILPTKILEFVIRALRKFFIFLNRKNKIFEKESVIIENGYQLLKNFYLNYAKKGEIF